MQEELKKILKENGWTGKELAERLGMSYGHYRKMTMSKRQDPPNWVNAFVIAYNLKNQNPF